MSKMIVAIDPGANGGIAWGGVDATVRAVSMPETPFDILDQLRQIKGEADKRDVGIVCYLEDVGGGRPGEGIGAACKFARHNGQLEAFLMAEDIPAVKVLPNKWMKTMGLGKQSDCKSKTEWKNKIKAKMQAMFPSMKVTLKTSDALAILTYAMEAERKN